MRKFNAVLILSMVGGWVLADTARAQDTNGFIPLPQTKLEAFNTNTGTIILKATVQIGTVACNAGTLSVRCREITDVGAAHRESGLVIGIAQAGQPEDLALIDYDELDSLIKALDFLNNVDWSVTSWQSFDATFTTRGGFRVATYGSRRTGGIEYAARNIRSGNPPLLFSRDRLAQLRDLLEQGRAKLEAPRTGKG